MKLPMPLVLLQVLLVPLWLLTFYVLLLMSPTEVRIETVGNGLNPEQAQMSAYSAYLDEAVVRYARN